MRTYISYALVGLAIATQIDKKDAKRDVEDRVTLMDIEDLELTSDRNGRQLAERGRTRVRNRRFAA